MNLGIDARLLDNNTGIGRYTRSLFFEYIHNPWLHQDRIVLFYDKQFQLPSIFSDQSGSALVGLPKNCQVVTAHCQPRILWTNWYLPPLLRHHDIDVYHGVCNFELPVRKMCRYVVTIHDLVPLFFPELVPKKHLLFFKLFMKRAAQTADLIITDSEHSKRDIVQHFRIPEGKIRVIYLGYTLPSEDTDDQQRLQDMLLRYGIAQPYLLFVGVIEPKKNLERLIDAFVLLQEESSLGKERQLVIAGGKGWLSDQLYRKVRDQQLEHRVLFTGFIPEKELSLLYRGAELFVFPSLYEGFGLPVVEAMSYGTPVVTSSVSSLPEIVGEAGMLVDPYEPSDICRGIRTVLSDTSLQAQMKEAGLAQARKFSWQRTAEETYNVYLDAYHM